MTGSDGKSRSRAPRKILAAAGLLLLFAIGWLLRDRFGASFLVDWLRPLGPWAPIVYMVIFLVAPPLFIPGAPITIAGGALFGPVWGTIYSLFAATGGAALAFLFSRYAAGEWVERRAGGILLRLKEGVEEQGWRFVAFTRLVPLFPFNALNYGFGLTRIKFSHYVMTSFVCMVPGAAAYSFIGYAGREAVLGGDWPVLKLAAALGVLLFVFMLPRLILKLRSSRAIEG